MDHIFMQCYELPNGKTIRKGCSGCKFYGIDVDYNEKPSIYPIRGILRVLFAYSIAGGDAELKMFSQDG